MRKTNLESTSRLKNQKSCFSYRGLLYNKATLFFALLLLPAMIFAQSNKQQQLNEKEARNQAYLDAKYGNKSEAKSVNLEQISEETIAQESEYQNLLKKLNIDEALMTDRGFSRSQIEAHIQELLVENEAPNNYFETMSRQANLADACENAQYIWCTDGEPTAGTTLGYTNDSPPNCAGFAGSAAGVWYKVRGNGELNQVILDNAFSGARMFLYTGGCGALTCVSDSNIGQGTTTLAFNTIADEEFLIYVSGTGTNEGAFTIEVYNPECSGPSGDGLSTATAYEISCGDFVTVDDTSLIIATEVPTADCGTTFEGNTGVWYTFSSSLEDVTVSTCDDFTDYDTIIQVYSGSPGNLECVGGNDEFCGNQSEVSFSAVAGTNYYVYVSGWRDNIVGAFRLDLECGGDIAPPPPSVPNNDLCPDAILISCSDVIVSGNTELATGVDVVIPSDCSSTDDPAGAGVWYVIEGDNNAYDINTCGSNYDTKIFVYSGSCGAFTCVTANDDWGNSSSECGVSFRSRVQFNALDGTDYYIFVTGYDGFSGTATGDFDLNITCDALVLPPGNDTCADAEAIACGESDSGNTIAAAPELGLAFCGTDVNVSPGAWYTTVGNGDIYTIDTEGSDFDTVLAVFTGSCGAFTCLGGDDDSGDGNTSSLTFDSIDGTTYYIYVSGDEGLFTGPQFGNYVINVFCQPDPCTNATGISCSDGVVYGNNSGANGSTINPQFCGTSAESPGVFYEFIGEGNFVNITTCDSNFDTKLNVYTGSCDALACLIGNDDTSGCTSGASAVDFFANDGESYFIWVSGFSGASGDFQLNITCQEAAENDLCDSAVALSCDTTVSGSTELSTDRGVPEEACNSVAPNDGVWYTVTGTGGDIIASTCSAADFDTMIIIYTGSCDDLVCYDGNDDSSGCTGGTSEVQFATVEGQTYYVYVTGFGAQKGVFDLTIDCLCAPTQVATECVTIYDGYDPASTATLTGNLDYAEGNVSYSWSNGAPNQQTITVDAADGTQNITVTMSDEAGCSATQEFFVYVVYIDCDRGNSDKIEICHGGTTICVSVNAAIAHLNHGDSLGACGTELCDELIPDCDITINSPASGSSDVSIFPSISWSGATGIVDGYNVTLSLDGVELVNENVVGLSYNVGLELDYASTYVVSVTPYNSNGSGNCNVSSSFTTIEDPLPNDDCDGAIMLTVNSDFSCGVVYAGNNIGATASSQPDDVTGTPNTDVWFSFVATSDIHRISLTSIVNVGGGTSSSTDMGMGVYNAESGCAALSLEGSSDPNTYNISGLTAGDTYVVRVYGWFSSIQFTTFDICVGTPPPPPPAPANDECADAISLTVNADFDCGVVTAGTTAGATASSEPDAISGTPNTDVWYSFVATSASHRVSLTNVVNQGGGTSTSTDMGMAVYNAENGCDALDLIGSSDPNIYNVTGLTVGETYVVRVYGWFSSIQYNNFNICLGSPAPPAGPVTVNCGTPINETHCYDSNEISEWSYTSSDGSPLTLFFTSGNIEESSFSGDAWDDLYIYDGTDSSGILLSEPNDGISGNADLTGMSFTASSGSLYMYFESDGSVSCQQSTTYDPWDFDVTCSGSGRAANSELAWTMYPNPSRGQVNLDLKDFVNNDIIVQVVDLSGNVVLNRTVKNLQDPKLQIELNNVPYGMYFVRVQSNDNVSTKKLIITN